MIIAKWQDGTKLSNEEYFELMKCDSFYHMLNTYTKENDPIACVNDQYIYLTIPMVGYRALLTAFQIKMSNKINRLLNDIEGLE